MLANHIQNGIESARVAWSRIPNSDESQFVDEDGVGLVKKNDGSAVESLDYEVIENFAYREEQVLLFFFIFLVNFVFIIIN
jgi:chloride channel 7